MSKRIVVAQFRHPSLKSGVVHFEDEHYPIVNGVVECPQEIGLDAEWEQVGDAEAKDLDAVMNAAKAPAPKGDAKK